MPLVAIVTATFFDWAMRSVMVFAWILLLKMSACGT